MLTPDQVRFRLNEAEEANATGEAWASQAALSILIDLLNEVLPVLADHSHQVDTPIDRNPEDATDG